MAKKEFSISLRLLDNGFTRGLNQAQRQLRTFNKVSRSFNSSVKTATTSAFSTTPIEKFNQAIYKVGANVQQQERIMKKSFSNTKKETSSLVKAIASVFAVDRIVDFGKSIFNVGSEFQNQMARVKAISGATTSELDKMKKTAESLGATTRYSATEAGLALENLLRNGLKTSEAVEALEGVLKLAGSQAIDLAKAADIATVTLNGFGLKAKELNKVIDILAAGASSSATDVVGLADGFKEAAPLASQLGLSLEELVAALGTLADKGHEGGVAGTALRAIMNRLIKPTTGATKALEKYGLSMSEAEIKANGFTKTLEKLSKANLSLADMKIIFGEEHSSRAGSLLESYSSFTNKKTALEGSQGTADRQFTEGVGSLKSAIDELSSSWEDLMIKLSESGQGFFLGMINGAKAIVEEFKKSSTLITGAALLMVATINKAVQNLKKKVVSDAVKESLQIDTDFLAGVAVQQEHGDSLGIDKINEEKLINTMGILEKYIKKIDDVYDDLDDETKKTAGRLREDARQYNQLLQQRLEYLRKLRKAEAELKAQQDYGRTSGKDIKPKRWNERQEWENSTSGGVQKGAASVIGAILGGIIGTAAAPGAGTAAGAKVGAAVGAGVGSLFTPAKRAYKARKDPHTYFSEKNYQEATKAHEEYRKALEELEKSYRESESQFKSYSGSAKSFADKLQSESGKSFQDLLNMDLEEGLSSFEKSKKSLGGLETVSRATGKALSFLGRGFVGVVKGALSLVGGPIGLLLTALTFVGTRIYEWWNDQNKVFDEIKNSYKELEAENKGLESNALSLAKVMGTMPKESAAWKTAMSKLSSQYPELLEKMKLEEVYLNGNAKAYDKLCESIKDVIKEQKNLKLEQHKQDSIEKLQKDYQEKTSGYGKSLVELFTGSYTKKQIGEGKYKQDPALTKEAAQIVVSQLESDIMTELTSGGSKKDVEAIISKYFKDYNINPGKGDINKAAFKGIFGDWRYNSEEDNRLDYFTSGYYDKYSGYGKAIKSIEQLIPEGVSYTAEKIKSLIDQSLALSESQAKEITATEKARGTSKEDIDNKIASNNANLLDALINKLNGISTKVDGKSALDFAQTLDSYIKLRDNSKTRTKTTGVSPETASGKTASQTFSETSKRIKLLQDKGLLDEGEARQRLINAYNTYISALESAEKLSEKDFKTLKELQDSREKLQKELEKSKKAEEESKARKEESEKISKSIPKAKGRDRSGYKWDKFSFSDKFESELVGLEFDFSKLDGYLQDLQSIGGDKFEVLEKIEELSKLGAESGVQELVKQLQILYNELVRVEKAATNLDDKIQYKKAMKEIKDMRNEYNLMTYDTIKEGIQGIDSLANSWKNLFADWSEMDFGEQFSGIINSVFGTIDTVMSFLESLKQVTEFLELMGLKKQALAAIEKTTSAGTVAGVQAEAAAVVAAEGEKTAAITGSVAAQTTAMLAAKTAQTKAATIAMAAESTAAYAGIPFAGVGLAAAQIAEMEALIAAAAALPMFAEGGIVGGTKYTGDQNLARVNSGEMIINRGQQKKLWDTISGGKYGSNNSLSGNVEFKISGQVLRGVLNNHDKKMSKIKG